MLQIIKIFLKNLVFILLTFAFFPCSSHSIETTQRTGMWITVFSPARVLYSTREADKMLDTAKKSGVDHIYLQVYRANKAYYNSDILDKTDYNKMSEEAGCDPIARILSQAKKNGIKVYAWINLLSISQNKNAQILKKLGGDILTRDKYGKIPLKSKDPSNTTDKAYIREDQIFLEPGDERVRDYLAAIAAEIMTKYPSFGGLHLDYVRYPFAVPFAPGSRFDTHAVSYGYDNVNVRNFKAATGIDARTINGERAPAQKWDNWRRAQVTELVGAISAKVKALSPACEISCAIAPSIERTYLVTFQDWTLWLKKKLVDYVVVMNYSDDARTMYLNSRSVLLPDYKDKIYIGIGAYLLKNSLKTLEEEITLTRKLSPGGIVLFSYDELAGNKELQEFLNVSSRASH